MSKQMRTRDKWLFLRSETMLSKRHSSQFVPVNLYYQEKLKKFWVGSVFPLEWRVFCGSTEKNSVKNTFIYSLWVVSSNFSYFSYATQLTQLEKYLFLYVFTLQLSSWFYFDFPHVRLPQQTKKTIFDNTFFSKKFES